ncbi:MAG TPA: hypothetical protein VFD00_02055 [Thermoclostridium sp.]|nr:hypothetical protein [Thermoclostridium sp.]
MKSKVEVLKPQKIKKYERLYKKVFKRLGNATPLLIDCGKLCDEICCSGSDDDGMWLFPGEEYLYLDKDWCHIKDANFTLSDGYSVKLLVCKGTCPRHERPLSCRIFPLMPYINEHDRVDFRIDLASVTICPIALEPDKYTIEDKFIDKLYKTFPPLLKDERVVEFIEILSKQYDETKKILLTPLIF